MPQERGGRFEVNGEKRSSTSPSSGSPFSSGGLPIGAHLPAGLGGLHHPQSAAAASALFPYFYPPSFYPPGFGIPSFFLPRPPGHVLAAAAAAAAGGNPATDAASLPFLMAASQQLFGGAYGTISPDVSAAAVRLLKQNQQQSRFAPYPVPSSSSTSSGCPKPLESQQIVAPTPTYPESVLDSRTLYGPAAPTASSSLDKCLNSPSNSEAGNSSDNSLASSVSSELKNMENMVNGLERRQEQLAMLSLSRLSDK